jgi:hypothetical protein
MVELSSLVFETIAEGSSQKTPPQRAQGGVSETGICTIAYLTTDPVELSA